MQRGDKMVTLHGTKVEVGDKVWSVQYGFEVVNEIVVTSDYPISVAGNMYTREGKNYTIDLYPSLFWQEVVIPPEACIKPLPQLEVDTKVLVWGEGPKHKRYFSHFDNGKICCFNDGSTSWAYKCTNEWANWELYND
jgi:hypothetical protein